MALSGHLGRKTYTIRKLRSSGSFWYIITCIKGFVNWFYKQKSVKYDIRAKNITWNQLILPNFRDLFFLIAYIAHQMTTYQQTNYTIRSVRNWILIYIFFTFSINSVFMPEMTKTCYEKGWKIARVNFEMLSRRRVLTKSFDFLHAS